jgi:hypothetical protein
VNKVRHFLNLKSKALVEDRSILLAFGCEREGSDLPKRIMKVPVTLVAIGAFNQFVNSAQIGKRPSERRRSAFVVSDWVRLAHFGFAHGMDVLPITIALGGKLENGFVWRLSHSACRWQVPHVTIVPGTKFKIGFDRRDEESFVLGKAHLRTCAIHK